MMWPSSVAGFLSTKLIQSTKSVCLKSVHHCSWKMETFLYFVLFPHISAMTKYFTSTQLLIFSTYGKIFQHQLFQHQNISTCPSFFCYGEIIFQITNFWIKRLLIRPKLFQHTTWIWLLSLNYVDFRLIYVTTRWSLEPVWTSFRWILRPIQVVIY